MLMLQWPATAATNFLSFVKRRRNFILSQSNVYHINRVWCTHCSTANVPTYIEVLRRPIYKLLVEFQRIYLCDRHLILHVSMLVHQQLYC